MEFDTTIPVFEQVKTERTVDSVATGIAKEIVSNQFM
jgi:hypothetical protein